MISFCLFSKQAYIHKKITTNFWELKTLIIMKLFPYKTGSIVISKVLLGKLLLLLFLTRIPQTNFFDILLIIFIIRHKVIQTLSII